MLKKSPSQAALIAFGAGLAAGLLQSFCYVSGSNQPNDTTLVEPPITNGYDNKN